MQFVGIDPGAKGAVAIIDTDTRRIRTYNIPIMVEKRATVTKRIVDAKAFVAILDGIEDDAQVYLEDVFSMPTDGHVGAFSFGMNKGALVALLHAHNIQVEYINPGKWKRAMKVSSDKAATKKVARGILPGIEKALSNEGKCEAFLIALYGLLSHEKASIWLTSGQKPFQVG